MRKKMGKKITPAERNKMTERIVKLTLRLRKIREAREKNNKKKPEIDIRKVAKGLGAEIITDPEKIAEMKKKKYPWRPE